MKTIEFVTIEQRNLIIDKIISFIKEKKSYNIDDTKLTFKDNNNYYSIYKSFFKDKISNIVLSNYDKNISLMFNISDIDVGNKINFVVSNILPLLLNYKKPLDNDEFFDIFEISPDVTVERSNKLKKILKNIFNI